MSLVSPSARTVTVNNSDDNYSNSDSTATTTSGGAEANNNNDNTNGSATSPAGTMVLRLASGDNNSRRRSGRSPTAAAAAGVSLRSGGGIRRGILKRPTRTISSSGEAPYVPAPVHEIIANVEDARIPVERDSDLTAEEREAKHQRDLALRRATATRDFIDDRIHSIEPAISGLHFI